MQLRFFNADGMEAFRRFLQQCREQPNCEVPYQLLESETHTIKSTYEIDVTPQAFVTKRDAADYFHDVLRPIPALEVRGNAELWTWLSLLNFDAVCPVREGKRKVWNDYRYVFEPNNVRHFYRHLLFVSWRVVELSQDHNRLFLGSRVDQMDAFTTEVLKRLYLTRIPCIFEVLDRVYWDSSKNAARKGVVDSNRTKAGDLMHRFPIQIRQLEKTYDLYSLSADQLIELLGDEFKS